MAPGTRPDVQEHEGFKSSVSNRQNQRQQKDITFRIDFDITMQCVYTQIFIKFFFTTSDCVFQADLNAVIPAGVYSLSIVDNLECGIDKVYQVYIGFATRKKRNFVLCSVYNSNHQCYFNDSFINLTEGQSSVVKWKRKMPHF